MRTFKTRLDLNDKQMTLAAKHAGTARHAYNWGLNLCLEAYQNKEKHPSAVDLHKKLVAEVKLEKAWYYDVSKCSPQQSLRNLETAYKRFFRKIKGAAKPVFKKKGDKDGFYLEGNIEAKDGKIKLPRFGWVRMFEDIELSNIKNVSITRKANQWFISFKIPLVKHIKQTQSSAELTYQENPIGVDLGIKTLAILSDGKTFQNRRPYKTNQRKLKLAQRVQSKRYVKGKKGKEQSNNYKKAALKVAKIHQRISNIRKDTVHKLTTYLAKNHSHVVIEDLNIKGMSKNHKLASAILDGGFYEFKRQLTYKCEWYGSELILVDRFYPSSKTCSACGTVKKELKLSERTYHCEHCSISIDRDLNAAINLSKKSSAGSVGEPSRTTLT